MATPPPLSPSEVEVELTATWWRESPLESADVWMAAMPEAEREISAAQAEAPE
jgi:hypothetical protein